MLDPTPSSQRPGQTPLLQTIGLTKRYALFSPTIPSTSTSGRSKSTRCSRERRRQVDAGQNYLWLDSAERRRNVLAGRENGARRPVGSTRAASAWCSSIFAVRQSHGRRERGAWPRRQESSRTCRRGCASIQCLRASARSQARGVATLGRRAPAHRNRSRADANPKF